jgi:hypothetical protein
MTGRRIQDESAMGKEEAPPKRVRWKLIPIVLMMCGIASYVGAYISNVRTANLFVIQGSDAIRDDGTFDPNRTWVGEEYRVGGKIAWMMFAPENFVDRRLRPEVWGAYRP